ncbi:MAG TPA: ATP-binding protein [Gemmatimonadaceae bacterium]|nr:ATP-binding protein [Gemmatimonadaceae bacterium]
MVSLGALAPAADAQHAVRQTHVLILYQQQAETRPMVEFGQQLRRALRVELGSPVQFYQEALDFDRFTGREHSSPLKNYFDDKYGRFGIDVIVPVGSRALRFAIDHLRDVVPNAPIVFALCAAPQTDPELLPAGVTGRLAAASRFESTLSFARTLQPDAARVVVIGGAGSADSIAVSAAIGAAAAQRDPLPIVVLQGLALDTLLRRVHEIPRRSIVIFANYRQDGRGDAFEPLDIIGSIARATPAPMYTQLKSYVGEGVVGGAVTRFDDEGALTARLVARVLHRRPGAPMPPVEAIGNSYVVDTRQLRRWALAGDRLLPGTELLFREPTLWQRYRTPVLFALGIMATELLLIGALLVERRRRKHAQSQADERRRYADETRRRIAKMERLAAIGELGATISHELRQPLAAIRTNAETGAKLMNRGAGAVADERELCREIFTDIIADDQRASAIIKRVRALVRGEDLSSRPIDVNDVCRMAARLLRHEAQDRGVELVLSLDPRLPLFASDSVQLQQVVLNLALNALHAAESSADPRVTIATRARDDDIEIAVHDSGPGIPLDVRQHLFDSFFTTKPDGLGLGLAIVRSIVERHQGRVHADNAEGGGATFRVVMPRNDRMRSVAEARRPAVTRSASSVSSVSSVSSDLVRLAFRE